MSAIRTEQLGEMDQDGRVPSAPGSCLSAAERWTQIPGFAEHYEVSDAGRVRNTKTGLFLNPYLKSKYLSVSLRKDGAKSARDIHVLVLTAFIGPRPLGHVGAHLDGNAHNNAASNLAWVTPSENERHKIKHGTHLIGLRSQHAKFTELQVKIIREANAMGLSVDKIGILTGVAGSTISRIIKRDSYGDI